MSKVFLPRIRDILKDRHNTINSNESIAIRLQDQVEEIESVSKNLRETSASQYKLAIDQSIKESTIHKEKGLLSLKLQTMKMVEESKAEMIKFRQNSQDDCQKIVDKLVNEISNKLFENKIN